MARAARYFLKGQMPEPDFAAATNDDAAIDLLLLHELLCGLAGGAVLGRLEMRRQTCPPRILLIPATPARPDGSASRERLLAKAPGNGRRVRAPRAFRATAPPG